MATAPDAPLDNRRATDHVQVNRCKLPREQSGIKPARHPLIFRFPDHAGVPRHIGARTMRFRQSAFGATSAFDLWGSPMGRTHMRGPQVR
ncbi:hypothetical protein SKA53_14951 [Yoonia vestfoldensis SKA53]|uniref:Uncharacterized protein n=1 Tax=Yoonia vestfoldensis SKA53 TaxID=314232 RepID=A3V5D8_9RHOB|nr:hypothetical protein SKA53_14951 [Yoonia vestfoldensis SKA53]